MKKVLFLISDLNYSFHASQLSLLATHLPASSIRVVVLARPVPWVVALRAAGIQVDVLGWVRPFDVRPLLQLYRLIRRFRPDFIHTWDPVALRFLSVAGGRKGARLIVSGALPRHGQSNWLDRCLIRSASRVLALGGFDATRYRALGLKEDRLLVAAPAIVAPPETSTSTMPAFPPNARVILCIGPITWLKGYRDAVWALDILNHLDDVHHLVFVGPAPEADKIARFARAIDAENRVRFVGPVASLGPWLQRADVVWVPSWKGDGTGAALEALATGKPVVASRWPALAEIVVDGETGFLIPAEDKAALAKQTHKILSDPEMARRMGTAGRLRALDVFSPQRLVERCAALYD